MATGTLKDTALVKLDGTTLMEDGSTGKTNLFKCLDVKPIDYPDIYLKPEEAVRVSNHIRTLKTGASAAIVVYCKGANCPFANGCPLISIDKGRREADPKAPLCTPVGRPCPIESQLLQEWTLLFLEEYEVDPKNATEFFMVRELAETELMLWRLNNNLAKPENAELVSECVVGVDGEGNALTRMETNAFLSTKETLQNRKARLIKLMVGDPEGKYKRQAALKISDEGDASTSTAQLKTKLNNALSQLNDVDRKIKEAEGKVIDVEYQSTNNPPQPPLTPDDLINEG